MKPQATSAAAVEQPLPKAELLQFTAELRALRNRIRRSAKKLPKLTSEERAGDAPLRLEAFLEHEMMLLSDEVCRVALGLEELANRPHRPLTDQRERIDEATSLGYPSHLRLGYGGERDPFWFVRGMAYTDVMSAALSPWPTGQLKELTFLLR